MRIYIYIMLLTFSLLSLDMQGQHKPRGGYAKLDDKIRLYDIGVSVTSYYYQSKLGGLQETLIRDEFFLPDSYDVKTGNRNGGGIAFAVLGQWHKNFYSQVGVIYDWQNVNSSSDFRFNNLVDPKKSFDLWLNYKYIGFTVESGVSISLPNSGSNGLIFNGLTLNVGAGFKTGWALGDEFVVYKSSEDLSSEDLKIQGDLRGVLLPQARKFNPFIVSQIGYKFIFVEFNWVFGGKDALNAIEDNIYNFNDNDNKRSKLLFGIGFRHTLQPSHRQ